MPWTFAHPAAILPLRRLFPDGRLLVGLVMGSLVPDLAYYLGGPATGPWGTLAHSLAGWWWLDAPLGALLAGLWLRGSAWIAAPLPQPYRSALQSLAPVPWADLRLWGLLLLASATGAATHLLWDGFTHGPGFFVQHWALLRSELGLVDGRPWQVFNALQHLSSLAGLGLLWAVHGRWWRRAGAQAAMGVDGRLACLGVAALLSLLLGALLTLPEGAWAGQIHAWVVRGVVRATVLFVAAYALLAWWWRER